MNERELLDAPEEARQRIERLQAENAELKANIEDARTAYDEWGGDPLPDTSMVSIVRELAALVDVWCDKALHNLPAK